MRGKVAKRLRKQAYGDHSHLARSYVNAGGVQRWRQRFTKWVDGKIRVFSHLGRKILTPDEGGFQSDDRRRAYQAAKKAHKRGG